MAFTLTVFVPYILALVIGIIVRVSEFNAYHVLKRVVVVEVKCKKIKPYGWFKHEDYFFTYRYGLVSDRHCILEEKYWLQTAKLKEGSCVEVWCREDENDNVVLCDRARLKGIVQRLFVYLLIVIGLMIYFLLK